MTLMTVSESVLHLTGMTDGLVARLLGWDERDARRALHGLSQRGWGQSVEPGSADLPGRRHYFPSERAIADRAKRLGVSLAELRGAAPVGRNDVLRRISRIEITAGVNDLCAGLAEFGRDSGRWTLHDVRSLPLLANASDRWWLDGVDGYVCIRLGKEERYAPAFVIWDRAAAPDAHRRQTLRRWVQLARTVRPIWGKEGLPRLLVLCPSEREVRIWERALERTPRKDTEPRLGMVFMTQAALREHGTGGSIWRRPDGQPMKLEGTLGWGSAPRLVPAIPRELVEAMESEAASRNEGDALRSWAAKCVTAGVVRPAWHHAAALVITLGQADCLLIGWISHHPLLSACELAALTDENQQLVERRLERLIRCRAIHAASLPGQASNHDEAMLRLAESRHILAVPGLQMLAASADTQLALFAKHGGVTYAKDASEAEVRRAVSHIYHQVGINRFMGRLAADMRREGGLLAAWRNGAESTHHFLDGNGLATKVLPDATVVLYHRWHWPLLIEYERGTLTANHLRRKLEGYRAYYATEAWRTRFAREPLLTFVCEDRRAEQRVQAALNATPIDAAVRVTAPWRYGEGSLLDRVWVDASGAICELLDATAREEEGR